MTSALVCVSSLARLGKNYTSDFHKIRWKGDTWAMEETVLDFGGNLDRFRRKSLPRVVFPRISVVDTAHLVATQNLPAGRHGRARLLNRDAAAGEDSTWNILRYVFDLVDGTSCV